MKVTDIEKCRSASWNVLEILARSRSSSNSGIELIAALLARQLKISIQVDYA
jgi:hypothetical protein